MVPEKMIPDPNSVDPNSVGAALVAAHGKHKKSSLPVGSHKGGPYITFDRYQLYRLQKTTYDNKTPPLPYRYVPITQHY